jgi:tryptophanyl-tRNA synthetase
MFILKYTMKVDPYSVSGNINYDKLLVEFGVQSIDDALLKRLQSYGPLHTFLRRKHFFAHRDLPKILDAYDAKKPFALYTGRAPSGPMHLGHMVPFMFTKWLQDIFDVEVYIQIPDEEKFLIKQQITYAQSQEFLQDNLLDIAAMGFNPKKTFFVIDTLHANHLYPIAVQIAKHLTFNMSKSVFGFTQSTNVGALFYTSMQSAMVGLPSTLHKKNIPILIPYAIDQDPHFRLTRDILPKLGYEKPASIQGKFLPGLAGMQSDGKMSSSQAQSAIYTTDDAKTIKSKINKYAFSGGRATIEEHRSQGGNPDVDVAYQWLTFFEPDDAKLEQIRVQYLQGTLLSGQMKALAIEAVCTIMAAHQKARATANVKQYLLKQ